MAPTSDGEIFARPVHWDESIEEPIVYIKHDKNTGDLSFGDRILTQITSVATNNFDYVGKEEGKFKNKSKGYIKGSKSKLTEVLNEYQKLTQTNLYRTLDFGMIEPKNEFEETLYFSSKRNQRELIQLIEEEIDRIK